MKKQPDFSFESNSFPAINKAITTTHASTISGISFHIAFVTKTGSTHFTKEETGGWAHHLTCPTVYINHEAEVEFEPRSISLQNSLPSVLPKDIFRQVEF